MISNEESVGTAEGLICLFSPVVIRANTLLGEMSEDFLCF